MLKTRPAVTAIKAKNVALNKKSSLDITLQVWNVLCPSPPWGVPSQYVAFATKLYTGLGSEISKATDSDRRILAALVAKNEPSLTLVSKSLFEALIKIRGFTRACASSVNAATANTKQANKKIDLPGSPLVYDVLDFEEKW
jgi:hypothetical protein